MKHLLILPPLLFFVGLSLIPLIMAIWFSLTNMQISGRGTFIGLDNYARLFNDRFFVESYFNTLKFALVGIPIQYVLGLIVALTVYGVKRGQRAVRLIVLVPLMIAPLIVGFIWQTLFDSRYGPINALLEGLGFDAIPFLTDKNLAFVAIVVTDTWQWTAFMFLILYAGLRTLPLEPFEAARVDGASGWRVFWDLTFPMLIPASLAAIVLRFIEAIKLFDIVFYITGGGPANATSTATLTAYFAGLRSGSIGYAAAMTVVMLISVIVLATVFLLIARALTGRQDRLAAQAKAAAVRAEIPA